MTELSDELLVAYVDGQLARKQTQAVEKVLEQDDVIAKRVAALKDAHSRLETAFDAILTGEEADAAATPAPHPPGLFIAWSTLGKVSLATAGLVAAFFMMLAGFGWPLAAPEFSLQLSGAADPDYAGSIPPSWQEDAARAHALLSRASVEVGLESQGNRDLVAFQLAQAIGPNLTVPDLSGQGLRFVRGQLLRSGDEPLAQLLYLGTSGAPLYIPLTKSDVEDWRAIGRDTYSKNGLEAGDSVVTTFGAGPFVAGASLAAFEAIGCAHIPVGVGNTDKLLAALKQLKPHCLAATPSYAMHIAEKLGGAKTSIERIIVGGEPGGGEESFRKKLQDAFGAQVYEIMGIGDIAASLWGECEAQAGMHFSGGGWIHVELIDPDSGKPVEVKDGAKGELVYTHLKREAAPLLRFRSRDHVQVWVSECICKRKTMRVRCIGRTDDMLIVRGVNVFPTAVREVVARFQPRAADPAFRAALVANLRFHPEWDPVLFPEKYLPKEPEAEAARGAPAPAPVSPAGKR